MNTENRSDTERFRFASRALPEETLHVVRFQGREGLNELFSFTIDLVSTNPALDIGKLLSDRATFRILREDGREAVFCGYPAQARQSGYFNGYSYYTVALRPTFWKMTQIVQSWIFLDQTLRDTVQELLRSQAFFTFPHRFELLRADYPRREFAMQHDESIYDYLLWRLEDQGAYYYFEQSEDEDTVCFADGPIAHRALPDDPELIYSPVSGLEGKHIREILTAFSLTQTQRPKRVVIRSYSWKNPNKPIVGMADVSPEGLGDVYLTDEDVESDAEAERLARIRAETLRCRERVFSGESSIPGIRPGYTFTLKDHYNPTFNRDYLVTDVIHEGSQESFINLGLGIPLEGVKDHLFYRNSFHCIEADRPFRPEKRAPRAKIAGVVHAFIDGARTDARPELDAMGRYKILFPFDVSGRGKGKASCWVRMAQQQVGKKSGMSFPLLAGTEVLVSFVDGNPDRPYITGALANAETGALVGDANNNISGISTAGGNRLVFNDSPKKQGLGMTSAAGSGFVISAGSTEAWFSKSNLAGDMSSIGASQVANVFHSTLTGHTILQETMLPHLAKYLFAFTEACNRALESLGDALLEKDALTERDILAIDVAKTLTLLTSTIGEANVFRKGRNSIYGYTVRSDTKEGVMSKLQTPVDWREILPGCLLALGGTVSSLVNEENETDEEMEQKKTELEEQYADGLITEEEYEEEKKKLAEKKALALTHTRARSMGDDLAEITATVILALSGLRIDPKKMGGILLHADTANIGLHARNAILLNVDGGMVLHVGDRLKDKLTDGYVDTVREQPILKWGSGDRASGKEIDMTNSRGKLFNFATDEVLENVLTLEEIQKRFRPNRGFGLSDLSDIPPKGLPFLVDGSDMRYTETIFLIESIDEIRKSLARKHIIVAKDGATESAIVVQKSGSGEEDGNPQQPSNKGGIYLTTKGADQIVRLDTPKACVTLNDLQLKLECKEGAKSSVIIQDNGIKLQLDDHKVFIRLLSDSITMNCDNGEISIKKDVIEMSNSASKVKINRVGINGAQGELTGVTNITSGAIRIV